MTAIPRDRELDGSLSLLRNGGYTFISRRCARNGSDVFETRLLGQRVVCMTGSEAAEVFYKPDRMTRQGALPPTALMLLQDKGSVHLLDGKPHRRRKEMFLSLMTPEGMKRLGERFEELWRARIGRWERERRVTLFYEARELLCRAVCSWAGVPLAGPEARKRTREFGAMIEGAGSVGPRNWAGMLLRARTERWARELIEEVRSGELMVPEGSAAEVIATHRDTEEEPLTTEAAAVELLNVLRPTVAVDRYIVFCALALYRYPESRRKLRESEDYSELFVQEVRRFYPFFPMIGGRVRAGEGFTWRGHRFEAGDWVLLDMYGTNLDGRFWGEDARTFRPERFREWDGSPNSFIPQGGGDHRSGHRCPGEWITIDLMKRATLLLNDAMEYNVPPQDLSIDLSRMPAIPKSRFEISNVRRAG
ncbi:Cytochrome P450 [Rubrobacter radiotolerans]|uniref:Cytochrome P450 n=1 Tax=Rubrobacter radiotolerans TaxID=42256 RepID=A0A023X6H0_RUBRA|nr:cytochrome P450 [Rubrobacter radiotolerans]AHY47654.1 Cytochrome P450 [Rubrobacter radiotolerans]MDX5895057.1 cytochrome P450 [Rubrobacter radiotolerans]SMC07360.1 fatty-acid peroxygenase [Rubrobacter radiotolerans DSM 5868]